MKTFAIMLEDVDEGGAYIYYVARLIRATSVRSQVVRDAVETVREEFSANHAAIAEPGIIVVTQESGTLKTGCEE